MSSGPRLRTDVVEVFVVRDGELLLMRRAKEPMLGTWQPVLGHAVEGETAVEAARRELMEETGLSDATGLVRFECLERVRPYYIPETDSIVLSPRFLATAPGGWEPELCAEHDERKWVASFEALDELHWPSQKEAWGEVLMRGMSL